MSTSNAIPEGRHDNKRKGNGSRPDGEFRRALLAGAFALALLLPSAGFAEEPVPAVAPGKAAVTAVDNLLITTPPPPPNVRKPVLSWGTGNGKSYWIPAVEILGFEALLNGYGRIFDPDLVDEKYSEGNKVYRVTPSTFWRHLTKGPWGFDGDNFQINQIQHPYQGAVYQGFARSAGLGFWESSAYTFLGSFVWEVAGETTKPSINDQVASGIGGGLLGEPLFRLSGLGLEDSGRNPRLLRAAAPGVVARAGRGVPPPPTGFHPLRFGRPVKGGVPEPQPGHLHAPAARHEHDRPRGRHQQCPCRPDRGDRRLLPLLRAPREKRLHL